MITPTDSPRILHVSPNGSDENTGTGDSPFRTVQHAANQARPGDTVRIHAGLYRENVDPPRGGDAPERPITFEAAGDGEAVLCGSEVVEGWRRDPDGLWHAEMAAELFSGGNPFDTLIEGDWFSDWDRPHHTAMLFLDGEELPEAPSPFTLEPLSWFARVENGVTRIQADFGGKDPTRHLVEATTRSTVFYPSQTGIDYVVVRGLTLRHAASNWAPPTAEQPALLGTHWSRGWVIEDNQITHSRCVGVSLGKYGDEFDNASKNTAEGYVGTIQRALERGWSLDAVGNHTVRRNHISHCEQAGIVGSLGAVRCQIVDNHIHHIHIRRLFGGAEQGGIKIHAAIDSRIEGNHVHHSTRGLWMDWMAQGTRISRNLCHHNREDDLFLEVNHGPCLVDRNLFLSAVSVRNWSEGTAFLHNLFGGRILPLSELSRETPWHPAHATTMEGISTIRGGEDRYINNLVANACDLAAMDDRDRPARGERTEGLEVRPSVVLGNQVLPPDAPRLVQTDASWRLKGIQEALRELPVAEEASYGTLGRPEPTGLPFETLEEDPSVLNRDMSDTPLDNANRVAGPFTRASVPSVPPSPCSP